MRQITIDFDKMLVSGLVDNKYAGYLGEHNATELVLLKPKGLDGAVFSVAFMTNGEVIHSKFFDENEELKIPLWQQLTQDNTLYVQLEAYDGNGDYLGKSNVTKLNLGSSVHGVDVIADADNADVYSDIVLNSLFRETLEDNVDTLDKLTTSSTGKLLFNGKLIEGTGGVSGKLDIEVETDTEDEYVLSLSTPEETIVTPNLKGKEGKQGVSGVYVGTGEMPDGYNVQIDPTGEAVVIPTKTSELINDSGFITRNELPESGGGNGLDGFSPIIDITKITGGHRVTITDVVGTKSFDVLDGKNGADGKDGEKGEKGDKGDKGEDGNDYVLTFADKTEIANTVVALLPKYNGEVVDV